MGLESGTNRAMETLSFTPEEARAGLRAMKSVALANGVFEKHERALLGVCAGALGVDEDLDALATIEPGELAAALPEGLVRERAVQALLLTAMMDGEATKDEAACVAKFASALKVDEPRVKNLAQLAEGRVKWMWVDLARKSFARPVFMEALREEGLGGIYKMVGPWVGLAQNPELAQRFIACGAYESDTFGRAYYDFLTRHGLAFPGEKGAVPERGVWHDLSHVLSGYGVTPEGEVSVVSFIAGYRREDPFFWLFTIALQFHMGLKVSPYSPGGRGHFDPARVGRALRRGMAMNTDLSLSSWDFWELMPMKLREVRARLGVPPIDAEDATAGVR